MNHIIEAKLREMVDNIMEHYEVGTDLPSMEALIYNSLMSVYKFGTPPAHKINVTSFYGIPNKHTTPLFTLIKGGKPDA